MGGYALSELPTEAMAHEAQPRGWCPTLSSTTSTTAGFELRDTDDSALPRRHHHHRLPSGILQARLRSHRLGPRKTESRPPDVRVETETARSALDISPSKRGQPVRVDRK